MSAARRPTPEPRSSADRPSFRVRCHAHRLSSLTRRVSDAFAVEEEALEEGILAARSQETTWSSVDPGLVWLYETSSGRSTPRPPLPRH